METLRIISIKTIALILFASCQTPICENTIPIFNSNSYESEAYKITLTKEIKKRGSHNLDYYLDGYFEKNKIEYLSINIYGKDLCAKAAMKVENWLGAEDIKRKKGLSYRGAKLVGLKFEMYNNNNDVSFVISNLGKIVN